jgi:spermidine/putrescine transport system ATP-binding protein
MRPFLQFLKVDKAFGSRSVIHDLSLDLYEGEFITILGESGSGKTTLLRLIAGFEAPTQGEIWLDGHRIDGEPPYRRPVNTVFQQYGLFPHLSVFENVAYGLRIRRKGLPKISGSEITQRVKEALALVRMGEFIQAPPTQLSGGQQQRVALARAMINRPKVLLLDEPLSALDANLRRHMQGELKKLHSQLGITFVLVTHDQEEAMALSDRICLLREGKIEQVASPEEMYHRPATTYAAMFIGHTNLLAHALEEGNERQWGHLRWQTSTSGPMVFSLRPEQIRLAQPGSQGIVFSGELLQQTFEGPTSLLEIQCGGEGHILRVRIPSRGERLEKSLSFECHPEDLIPIRVS